MKHVIIHTDGGCQGNPGPGAWAAVLTYGEKRREISGAEPATTNNRMELRGAIEALALLREPCQITFYTDSEYLRQGVSAWIHSWKKNGWRTKTRQPVKNEDLWRRLDQCTGPHQIEWRWLRGHAGHQENERCDALATAAIAALRAKTSPAQLKTALEEFRRSTAAAEATAML